MQRDKYHFYGIVLLAFLFYTGFTNAQAEEPSKDTDKLFSLVLIGGVSFANTIGGSPDYPLYAENFGGFAGLQLRYLFLQKYGVEFHFTRHFLAADAEKAASELLHSDQNAQSVSLRAGTIHIDQFGVGVYRYFALNENIGLLATPRLGLSALQTPTITANITTEPITDLKYESGRDPALFFALDVAVLYQITRCLRVEFGIGYSYASHNLTILSDSGQNISEKWKYGFFSPKIGISCKLF